MERNRLAEIVDLAIDIGPFPGGFRKQELLARYEAGRNHWN